MSRIPGCLGSPLLLSLFVKCCKLQAAVTRAQHETAQGNHQGLLDEGHDRRPSAHQQEDRSMQSENSKSCTGKWAHHTKTCATNNNMYNSRIKHTWKSNKVPK